MPVEDGTILDKDVTKMNKEDLKSFVEGLRLARKKGYEVKAKVRKDNPFAGVSPEIAQKILDEIAKKGDKS